MDTFLQFADKATGPFGSLILLLGFVVVVGIWLDRRAWPAVSGWMSKHFQHVDDMLAEQRRLGNVLEDLVAGLGRLEQRVDAVSRRVDTLVPPGTIH